MSIQPTDMADTANHPADTATRRPYRRGRFVAAWTLLTGFAWSAVLTLAFLTDALLRVNGATSALSSDWFNPGVVVGLGVAVGAAQWLVLRRYASRAWLWPLATVAGAVTGAIVGLGLVGWGILSTLALAVVFMAVFQALTFSRAPRTVIAWIVWNALCLVPAALLMFVAIFIGVSGAPTAPDPNFGLADRLGALLLTTTLMAPIGLAFGFCQALAFDGVAYRSRLGELWRNLMGA